VHGFAAPLLYRTERNPAICRPRSDTDFFFEFNLCTREQVLAHRCFAFGNRPRASVFVPEEWAARMNQEHVEPAIMITVAKHQEPRAEFRGRRLDMMQHVRQLCSLKRRSHS
jgi:hypothetical protein